MKHPSKHEDLLNDVFSEPSDHAFRAESLNRSLSALNRRRRTRVLLRTMGVVSISAAVVLVTLLHQSDSGDQPVAATPNSPSVAMVADAITEPDVVPGTTIRVIGEEELYRLFAEYNQPIGIVGSGKNRRIILFND